jgi:outer membrane protein TolC
MKHRKATVFALALSAALLATGCAQKCCIRDYDKLLDRWGGLPADLECNPNIACERTLPHEPTPPTVDNPEREPWYITLHEAIAMALENGTTGVQSIRLPGTLDDDLVTAGSLGGPFPFGDSIRVLAFNPAITYTNIEASLARYDVVSRSILGFNTQDQPTGSSRSFNNGQFTAFGTSLEKANPYGGLANITFGSPTNQGVNPGTNFYSKFTNPSVISGTINPQYTPDLRFAYTQPLLRNFGPDINSLLPQHPEIGQGGAQGLNDGFIGNTGIVIARIAFDNSRADFERAANFMLMNVEFAYWNLYGSFINLYATEQAMKMAHKTWTVARAQFEAGKTAIFDVAQAEGQFQQFRGDRLTALGKALEAERTLRGLLGLPMSDGKRLIPVDTPTVAPYLPDWDSALEECRSLRPELVMQRNDLKQKQLELKRELNTLLPELDFQAAYTVHGAGTGLDGDSVFANGLTQNAFRSLAGDHFNDYSVGVVLNVPLGFRAQNAAVRAAKLTLARSYYQLRDEEYRATRFLRFAYDDLIEKYRTIEARRSQRRAYTEELESRFKLVIAGSKVPDPFLLQAQRDWATALQQEYQAIVDYNNALSRFNFAKGTIMEYENIAVAEGPLPSCAFVKAVDNERRRADAIVCRERANVVTHQQSEDPQACPVPNLPVLTTPSLPALQQGKPPMELKLDQALPVSTPQPRPAAPASSSPAALSPAPAHAVPTTGPEFQSFKSIP